MLVFLYTNDHYEHLFNLQATGLTAVSVTDWPLSHTMLSLKSIWRICTCYDVHYFAYLKVKLYIVSCLKMTDSLTDQVWFSFFKCKRKFERDCKEADRAQQYFEKMDADINVTKADVEKVCAISAPCRSHQSHELVLYPPCLTLLPGLPHHPTMHPPLSLAIFFYILFPPSLPWLLMPPSPAKIEWPCVCCQWLRVKAGIVSAAQWSAENKADSSTESSLSL